MLNIIFYIYFDISFNSSTLTYYLLPHTIIVLVPYNISNFVIFLYTGGIQTQLFYVALKDQYVGLVNVNDDMTVISVRVKLVYILT